MTPGRVLAAVVRVGGEDLAADDRQTLPLGEGEAERAPGRAPVDRLHAVPALSARRAPARRLEFPDVAVPGQARRIQRPVEIKRADDPIVVEGRRESRPLDVSLAEPPVADRVVHRVEGVDHF